MKKAFSITGVLIGIAILALLPIACGGGGDGGGVTPGGGGGGTSPTMVLDQTKVDEILTVVDETMPFCTRDGSATQAATSTMKTMARLGTEVMDSIGVQYANQTAIAPSATVPIDPIPGDCATNPGQLVPTIDMDQSTGAFSGQIDFQSLCIDGGAAGEINIDGAGTFNGTIDDLENPQSVTLNVATVSPGIQIGTQDVSTNISITGFSMSLSLNEDQSSGTLSVTLTDATVTATDSEGEESVSLTNFTLSASVAGTGEVTNVTINASGTVSQTGEGTVTFTLTDVIIDSDGNIVGGSIVIAGANNTTITITPTSGSDFVVSADTDGDGTDDFSCAYSCDTDLLMESSAP